MRNSIASLLFILIGMSVLYGQENICLSGFTPATVGSAFELTSYDKRQKVTSVARHKVMEYKGTSQGFVTRIDIELLDGKGKEINRSSYELECRDGILFMDMSTMLDPRTREGLSGMELEISGDALQIPTKLTVGQSLPDGSLRIKASTNGMALLTMSLRVTDRLVEATESVTTTAGTFDCYKVSQQSEMESFLKRKFRSATWYAKGIGTVRSENYDSKGELESYTVLTSFVKG
jgi:hypothetical protein